MHRQAAEVKIDDREQRQEKTAIIMQPGVRDGEPLCIEPSSSFVTVGSLGISVTEKRVTGEGSGR